MARVRSSKSNTVVKSGIVASEELQVAPEKGVIFDNGVKHSIGSDIEVQGDVHGFADKAARLAFMEEPVAIVISEGTEKDAERYVYLAVNGIGAGPNGIPWVPRGVEVTVKRKYLEVLAKARQVRYKNFESTNNDGERQSGQRASSSDRYPFQVIEDRNPKGLTWLRELRATRRA